MASEKNLRKVKEKLISTGLKPNPTSWGVKFSKPYTPAPRLPSLTPDRDIKIKIELSLPRIYEDSSHYFEFNLKKTCDQIVVAMDEKNKLKIKTPELDYLVANKLGVPSDFRSQHDIAVLLPLCDERKLVNLIKRIDRWSELVLRRTPKTVERISNPTTKVHDALLDVEVDTQAVVNTLTHITDRLKL